MAENSKIEWTDHTFNPWIGCTKVSPGCDHCYAETWDARGLQHRESRRGPHAARMRTSAAYWRKPLAWNKAAQDSGKRARVFCASLADVFDNHASISPEWRHDLWELIYRTPNLDWLLLTKRPQNINKYLPDAWLAFSQGKGWPNVWLGTTAENQAEADRRIPHLLATPAAVRFVSAEPLLGPVDLTEIAIPRPDLRASLIWDASRGWGGAPAKVDWVICGGESGPGARPMHPDWARSLRDQCHAAGVPFFFKQWGEWGPLDSTEQRCAAMIDGSTPRAQWHDACGLILDTGSEEDGLTFFSEGQVYRIGKRAAGRKLDGQEWSELPGR
jgi:protein gp37